MEQRQTGISRAWIAAFSIGAVLAAALDLLKPHHRSAGAALFVALVWFVIIALIVRGVIWVVQRTG